jgi:hypothetical protein
VTETIYVYLPDEFKLGSLVRCEWRELAEGRHLVASEEVG